MPSLRASDKPIAIACLRLVTFLPLRPLFSLPLFISCISRSTFLPAEGLYLLELDFLDDFFVADFFVADLFVADLFAGDFVLALLLVLFLLVLFLADDFFADFLLAFFVAINILPIYLRRHNAFCELHHRAEIQNVSTRLVSSSPQRDSSQQQPRCGSRHTQKHSAHPR